MSSLFSYNKVDEEDPFIRPGGRSSPVDGNRFGDSDGNDDVTIKYTNNNNVSGKNTYQNNSQISSSSSSSNNNEYIFCCIPWKWISNRGEDPKIGLLSTVVLLLNAMIGSGILVQPYVFKESGIINGMVTYFIVAYMTYTGVDLLIRAADLVNVFDYSLLAIAVFGPYGQTVVDIAILIGNTGALLSYILIVGALSHNLLSNMLGFHWFTRSSLITSILITTVVLPSCLIRKFGHLTYISYLSIFAIAGTMLLVCINGPLEAYKHANDELVWSNNKGSVQTIGSVVFAFGYASSTFHAYIALSDKNRTPNNFSTVVSTTTTMGVTMCFLTGFVGYVSFRNDVSANILDNFHGYLGGIFKLAVIMHLLLYIPGDFVVMRSSLFRLIGLSVTNASDLLYIIITVITLTVITISACLINEYASTSQSLTVILDITGGISGSITNFILPGIFSVIVLQEDTFDFIRGVALTMFGFCILVLVIFTTFSSITSA